MRQSSRIEDVGNGRTDAGCIQNELRGLDPVTAIERGTAQQIANVRHDGGITRLQRQSLEMTAVDPFGRCLFAQTPMPLESISVIYDATLVNQHADCTRITRLAKIDPDNPSRRFRIGIELRHHGRCGGFRLLPHVFVQRMDGRDRQGRDGLPRPLGGDRDAPIRCHCALTAIAA
jgi:hypothetical protein